jgi:subtilisin family serine protease
MTRSETRIVTSALVGLLLAAVALTACRQQQPPSPPDDPFSYLIDTAIVPYQPTLLGPGGERPVVALRGADGLQYDFIATEVIVLPSSQAQLDSFLQRRGGSVVTEYDEPGAERTVIVRVDAAGFPLDDLEANANREGIPGEHRFSSELGARLVALVLHERGRGLQIATNGLGHPDQSVLLEALEDSGEDVLRYFAFDNDAERPGVAQAWQYLAGHTIAGPLRRVRVAIIDGGFAVKADGTTFTDANGLSDFPTLPLQYDFVNETAVVNGVNAARCSGDSACPWHGHGAASVATGRLGNGAYRAGTGGQVADPIFLNVDLSTGQVKAAVDRARGLGAEVINLSFGGDCGFFCQIEKDVSGYYLAFGRALQANIVMVAAAGNEGEDSFENDRYPCALPMTICVGSLGRTEPPDTFVRDNVKVGFSNYGLVVDIYAPTQIPAWYGSDPNQVPGIMNFGGTSASSPYVAGVVAMMRSVNPSLSVQDVFEILMDTAWTDSPDPLVPAYLNAYEAVRRASEYRQPNDRFEPNDSGAAARTLSPGAHQNLTIGRTNDADFYRVAVAGPTVATIGLTYPGSLGRMSLPPYGRETSQACGTIEQTAYAHAANGLSAAYRLAAGSFVYAATSPGNPLPYHMGITLGSAPIAADPHEPNNTYGTATYVGDGGYVHGTLHSLSDVDFYTVYSQGSFSTLVLSMHSRARVETSDLPLTIQRVAENGTVLDTATSSSDCSSQATLELPQGFHRIRVSGSGVGEYRLWLGSYGEQHPIIDVENWFYLILHPDVPVSLVLREPEAWFVINHVSDYPIGSLLLEGPGLHLRLFDESGLNLLGEGVSHANLQGQTLSLPPGSDGGGYLLQVSRTEVALPGAELPVIPATIMSVE